MRWQYDEMRQVGTDYGDISNVRAYDDKMGKIRDFKKQAKDIMKAVDLKPEHVIFEIGTGTGILALKMANHCRRVYAIDVSSSMLDYAKEKARKRGISNVSFIHSRFLNYEHKGLPIDVIITHGVLHHLPDFWKMVALKKAHDNLKSGGVLCLGDVIFSFPPEEYEESINQWISSVREKVDEEFGGQAESHVKEEYSTFDWVIERMLTLVGFSVKILSKSDFFATYICKKAR